MLQANSPEIQEFHFRDTTALSGQPVINLLAHLATTRLVRPHKII
jgi:hypothetical protein